MLKDFRTDTWEEFKTCVQNKKVFLFGAGKFGQNVWNEIKKYETKWNVVGFLDNDSKKWNNFINELEVYSPNILGNYDLDQIVVLICSMQTANIAKQLNDLGIKNYFAYFFLDLPSELRETCDQPEINKSDIDWFVNRLEDEKSKIIVQEIIQKRKSGFFDYTDIRSLGSEYFNSDIFEISENEVFVDGGGFDGDTIEEFSEFTKGKYKRIYSFEPQKNKAEIIKNKLWRYGDKVVLFEKGLYDCSTELYFSDGNASLSGRIEDAKTHNVITTIDIDSAINEEVSFIKMDIEGAELKALQGAAETIKRYKPKLAICIYHKPEDIWEIPKYIDSLVPEYKFFVRHFGWRYTSTVLYCTL